MDISRPRIPRNWAAGMRNRSSPRNTALPEIRAFGSWIKRSRLSTVTLFPAPDSPTTPSASPAWTENDSPSTAVTVPWRLWNATRRSRTSSSGSGIAHPRVQAGVADVDKRVGQHHEEGRVHDRAQDDRQVDVLQRDVREPADAGQPEDDLGQQRRATDEGAEVQPEERHDRDQRAAQRVPDENAPLRDPLRSRGPYVVLVEVGDQLGPHQPGVDAGEEHRQGEPRE